VIPVCHTPAATSKWNKIEHRPFSFTSINWRAKPLTTYRVIVNLIAATTTQAFGSWSSSTSALPDRHQGDRRRARRRPSEATRVARGMELHHPRCNTLALKEI
jgi:hypothetical protein